MTTRVSSPNIARENSLMRSVVRNVVVNMECVLDDLRGIMGEITTIVAQIDSVTEKIDNTCNSPKGNRGPFNSHHENSHVTNSKSCLDYPIQKSANHKERANFTTAGSEELHVHANHNGSQVYGLKRGVEEASFINDKETPRPKYKEEPISISCEAKNELAYSSRRFYQFPNDRGGAIAIVYPTIITPQLDKTDMSMSTLQKLEDYADKMYATTALHEEPIHHESSGKQCNVIDVLNNVSLKNHILETEIMQIQEKETKRMFGKKTIYNKDFQPLMTSEKSHPVTDTKELCHILYNVNTFPVSSNLKNTVFNSSGNFGVDNYRDISPQQHHKVSTTTGNSDKSPSAQSSPSGQEESKGFICPHLNYSEFNQLYTRDQACPEQSSNARCHSKFDSCYYSTESDLDSDSTSDNSNRCLTPDIDWSYLKLIGSRCTQQAPTKAPDSNCNVQQCKVSAMSVSQTADASHVNATTNPEIRDSSVLTLKQQFNMFSNPDRQMHEVVPILLGNHLFCSEVISSGPDGYCGYYEAIVDAVLENIAGFEPLEEDISSMEALHEICLSFDNEFEEDALDVGMKSDEQDEYKMPLDYGCDLSKQEENTLGSMGDLSDEVNMLAAKSHNSNRMLVNSLTNGKILSVLDSGTKGNDVGNKKQKFQDTMTRLVISGDHNAAITEEALFNDEYCSNVDPKLDLSKTYNNLHGMSVISDDENTTTSVKMHGIAEPEVTASSFNVISRATVRSLSPMSLSSSETTYTSRETEYHETSSDGNDFMTSQDDLSSMSSEIRCNFNSSIHKAKMKRLRRNFFKSLYKTGESTDTHLDESNDSRWTHDGSKHFNVMTDTNTEIASVTGNIGKNITANYSKTVNTWMAFARVNTETSDFTTSSSDIFNENSVSSSVSSSCLDTET